MHAFLQFSDERAARARNAWAALTQADTRTDIGEMIAAQHLASAEGIDYCDALDRVRADTYARQETLDGAYPTTD